jgi:hypothetical protein
MTTTSKFDIPLLYANQAQKDVTVNQALVRIDSVLQLNVVSRTLTLAPTLPSDEDKYIVAAGATGVWEGQDGAIAIYNANGSTWSFLIPKTGWTAYSIADNSFLAFNGSVWLAIGYASVSSEAFGQLMAMMALIYG